MDRYYKVRKRYYTIVDYLKYSKYGKCELPYFDENGSITNEIWSGSNKNELLDRHHIDEWDIRALNKKPYLKECQQPDRLVWCHRYEHILLHILIWYACGKDDGRMGWLSMAKEYCGKDPKTIDWINKLIRIDNVDDFINYFNVLWHSFQKHDRIKGGAW